ncbi:IS3 family transposase [Streptomyces shenzhenensis]|uniref:IS3 family transposase n=1 Tax=Streptomyces shenzhenensis TaxID=943815 RepID=UPI00381C2AD7
MGPYGHRSVEELARLRGGDQRLLKVEKARFGYHRHRATPQVAAVDEVREIRAEHHGVYGVPRIHAELRSSGRKIHRKRVTRLMRINQIVGRHLPRTQPGPPYRTWPCAKCVEHPVVRRQHLCRRRLDVTVIRPRASASARAARSTWRPSPRSAVGTASAPARAASARVTTAGSFFHTGG